jgi:hypothetical protein
MYLYSIRRCGNEVFTHRAGRMSIEATILLSLLCLFWVLFFYLFYLQIWCWTEIREKEKKRCELSVFLLYLFIHVHYLFSMRMHLFKSIYVRTHKVTNMIIIRAHSMCQNYHIYFVWSRLYIYIYSLILFNTSFSFHLLI